MRNCFLVLLAFGLAILVPGRASVLAPLLLGFPHLVADTKYFFQHPQLPSGFKKSMFLVTALIVLLSLTGLGLYVSFVGLAGILVSLFYSKSTSRSWITGLLTLILLVIAIFAPMELNWGLVLGHNLVTLFIWGYLFVEKIQDFILVMLLMLIGSAVILSGQEPWLPLLVFLQLLHYLVWLVWIPRQTSSWLLASLTAGGLLMGLALTVGEPILWKDTYLLIVQFHVYLEMIILAYFFVNSKFTLRAKVLA